MELKKCLECNNVFSVHPYKIKTQKYCSTDCRNLSYKKYNYERYITMKKQVLKKICKSKNIKCEKCGINDIRVLCINHLLDKDKIASYITGTSIYTKIRKNNYKNNEFNVLCMNCNHLYEYERGRYGN